jgi:hypothetical protein
MMFVERFFNKRSHIAKADIEAFCQSETENLYVELKERVVDEINTLLKPVTAFMNARGGLLILGVSDKGHVVGLDLGYNVQKLTNIIRDNVEPSAAGRFNVIKASDCNCYLIDIEPMPFIVGVKIRSAGKISHMFFIRNAHESKKLNPSELQQIAIEKADYEYNENYRSQILNCIIDAEDTYDLLGSRDNKTKHIIYSYIQLYNSQGGIHASIFEILKQYVRDCEAGCLNAIDEEIVHAYERIISVRTNVKHKANLTKEEDEALDELQDDVHSYLQIAERPTSDEVYAYFKLPHNYRGNLSLKSYLYTYADIVLKDHIKTSAERFFWEYDKSILESVNSMLDEGARLETIKKAVSDLCTKHKFPKKNIDSLSRLIDKFPEEFMQDYFAIMGRFETLKDATWKALYLES